MREYVSKMECEHCRQVWDIFREYFEEEGETCGVDAYPMDLLYSGGLNQGRV